MNNIMLPAPHKILKVVKETRAEYTFRVAYEGETRHGQFFQLSIPKVGEAPISVSGKGEGWVEFTIRKVGRLTEGIFGLGAGDLLFMRGPYGNSFPVEEFEGKDLDGNKVDSSVFAENAVTVVNFWFNECKPCVEELSEMNALNDRIKEQGGEVLGVNVGALDGDEQNIATAKQILETKGAKYRNIYFDSDSDAGKFALGVTAFPTTYVIDRNGNIVGEALMGGIDNDENLSTLQNTIDEVLAKDAQK